MSNFLSLLILISITFETILRTLSKNADKQKT